MARRTSRSRRAWTSRTMLYRAYGFEVIEGGRHIVVRHPEFPDLNTTVARHNELDPAYARTAVRLIDELLRRKAGRP